MTSQAVLERDEDKYIEAKAKVDTSQVNLLGILGEWVEAWDAFRKPDSLELEGASILLVKAYTAWMDARALFWEYCKQNNPYDREGRI